MVCCELRHIGFLPIVPPYKVMHFCPNIWGIVAIVSKINIIYEFYVSLLINFMVLYV